MSSHEITNEDTDYPTYAPMHNYRRVDVDAWAEQWFAGFTAMDLEDKQRQDVETVLTGSLGLHPDERESDARDLSLTIDILCLIGQANPYNPHAASTQERIDYLGWEQKQQLACLVARQIVRRTLDDAEAYVTLRIEQERAGRDSLTGAYNRRGLVRRLLGQYRITNYPLRLDQTRQPLPPVKLTYFYGDVNGLKWINDHLGHHIGDSVIVGVTGRIHGLYRESDAPIIYRQGGDEFGVILGNVSDAEVESLIDRITSQQLAKIHSDAYQNAMRCIADRLEEAEKTGRKLRVEARRGRNDDNNPNADNRTGHSLYINGDYIAPLYDIFTSAVGVASRQVGNLEDLEQLRQAAEMAMLEAKKHFPREDRAIE